MPALTNRQNLMQTKPSGGYATINGLKMYYEVHGAGQPLVLIHGGGSTLDTSFGTIIPPLAQAHQVIAVDMQAHGRTADRDVRETFIQDADDIAALLDHLGIAKASIFGFSNGGQTCIEIALRHPEKVNKLVIASAFYKRKGTPDWFWPGFADAQFSHMPQVYKDEYLKLGNSPDALMNMFNRDVERMSNFKDWSDEAIGSIKAPVLIVQGDRDLPLLEHAVEFHRLLANSRLAILPGDHGSYMGEAMSWGKTSRVPELFVALLNEFLA